MSRNILICDFDETISNKDTISTFARLAYHVKPTASPNWSHFETTYMNGYNHLQPKYVQKRSLPLLAKLGTNDRITMDNYNVLFGSEIEYQRLCRNIELNSIQEIEKYNLFKGVSTRDVSTYVHSLFNGSVDSIVRKGFIECLGTLNIDVHDLFVISINWSRELIQDAISQQYISSSNIYCNDLLLDQNKESKCVYTGNFSKSLLTGSDKIEVLNKLYEDNNGSNNAENYNKFWYVGDSETDILCILEPQINGILLLDPQENEKKFLKLSIDVLGLDENTITNFMSDPQIRSLRFAEKQTGNGSYLAKTWFDITTLIQQNM
ncbi:similar to Saccharomyces cerevisiae YCR015C Putative protein of unknown function [Maudiozyma barnettii]|uniref:Uncharacterized protein n=1 Tax=Maudiozyma barnettii TaxID=61262 RepID=A0A8H2ZGH6_9SACH|nr:Cto1p [Kazachstania barnettii]CAB4252770.1 similar to Saccharomyces cerevisiae YCR015C Putative protein of unknown function [Kazachstania barnettii]CAD1780560.1 similar to Saccharomyces cerevisiae YCR015C Putative protein of unknown function [Kazachstania barnettii]